VGGAARAGKGTGDAEKGRAGTEAGGNEVKRRGEEPEDPVQTGGSSETDG